MDFQSSLQMDLELSEAQDVEPPLPKPRLLPRYPSNSLHSILIRSGSRDKPAFSSAPPSCLTSPALSRCSSNSSTPSTKGVRFAMTSVSIHPTHSAQAYDRAPYRKCQSLEIPQCKASEAWMKCVERNVSIGNESKSSSNFRNFPSSPNDFELNDVAIGSLPGLIQDDSSGSDCDSDLMVDHMKLNGLGYQGEDDDTKDVHQRFGICALNGNWTRASLYANDDILGGF